MAFGQSIASAWLMGAISPKRHRQSAHTDPPEPASSGGFFIFWSAALFAIPPAKAGTGDPDPGARASTRVPEARGLPEVTRRKPDTDGRANQEGFAMAARRLAHVPEKWEPVFPIRTCAKSEHLERRDRICSSIWFAASR